MLVQVNWPYRESQHIIRHMNVSISYSCLFIEVNVTIAQIPVL